MISSHSFSWMSSRTASSASMLEWMSETIAVRFMTASRGQGLQHVEFHEVHLMSARLGQAVDQVPLEGQEGGRLASDAPAEEPHEDTVAAHVDQLYLQPVP